MNGLKYSVPALMEEEAAADVTADLEIKIEIEENSSTQCADFVKSNTIPCAPRMCRKKMRKMFL